MNEALLTDSLDVHPVSKHVVLLCDMTKHQFTIINEIDLKKESCYYDPRALSVMIDHCNSECPKMQS